MNEAQNVATAEDGNDRTVLIFIGMHGPEALGANACNCAARNIEATA